MTVTVRELIERLSKVDDDLNVELHIFHEGSQQWQFAELNGVCISDGTILALEGMTDEDDEGGRP